MVKLKAIVTGAAGFIGSNLSRLLLDRGYDVIGIDNFSYGEKRNIEPFLSNPAFTFYKRDLCNPSALNNLNADVLVHLASYKIPRYSGAYDTLENNLLMLKNVVQHSRKNKIKIVYTSTSDVYGKNKNVPFHEECDLVLGPTKVKRWAYASSKIYGEQYIIANGEEFGLNYSIARLFGSYGPNQNLTWWGGPQSVFIANSFLKKAVEIHGSGEQTRTFTYIEDTIDALFRCIADDNSNKEIFNVGSEEGSEISIKDLAVMIWKLINGNESEPLLNFIPYSTFGNYEDVMRRVPDITKIKTLLGYAPKYGLKQGLNLTIDWQRKISNPVVSVLPDED